MAERRNLILRIWDYFRNSWEGDDGKFSYRRFSQYLILTAALVMVYFDKTQTRYGYLTFLTLLIVWCLITALITVQQLLLFFRYYTSRDRLLTQTYSDEETPIIDSDLLANPDGVQRPLEHPLDQLQERKKEEYSDPQAGDGSTPGPGAV